MERPPVNNTPANAKPANPANTTNTCHVRDEHGVGLVEVLVATAVLSTGVLMVWTSLHNLTHHAQASQQAERATSLVHDAVERHSHPAWTSLSAPAAVVTQRIVDADWDLTRLVATTQWQDIFDVTQERAAVRWLPAPPPGPDTPNPADVLTLRRQAPIAWPVQPGG
jgi:hypothetical protein